METTISSNTKSVVIGPEHPFVIIGERINPTGRKRLAESLAQGDMSLVRQETLAQVEAGAQVIDLNTQVTHLETIPPDEPDLSLLAHAMPNSLFYAIILSGLVSVT